MASNFAAFYSTPRHCANPWKINRPSPRAPARSPRPPSRSSRMGWKYRAPGTRDSHGELPTVRRGDDPALEDLLRRLPAGAGGASRAAYRSQASSPSRSGVVIAAERSAAGKGNRLPDISCAKRHPRSDLRQPEPAPLAMGRIEASQSVPPLLVSSLRLTCSSLATLTPGRPGCCVLERGLLALV